MEQGLGQAREAAAARRARRGGTGEGATAPRDPAKGPRREHGRRGERVPRARRGAGARQASGGARAAQSRAQAERQGRREQRQEGKERKALAARAYFRI